MPDALTYRWILVSAYNPFVNQAILAMRGVCCMFCCLLPGFATGEKGIFKNIKGNLQTTKKIVVICRFLSTPFSFLSFYCACVYIFLFFLSLVGVTLLLNYCSFLSLQLSQVDCKSKEDQAELFPSLNPKGTKCRFSITNILATAFNPFPLQVFLP